MSQAEESRESEEASGPLVSPSRYVDATTEHLGILGANFEDVQRVRLAVHARGAEEIAGPLEKVEEQLGRALEKALRSHALWVWLAPLKGLHGPMTARLLGMIGDPRRYPGRLCTEGHHLPADRRPATDYRDGRQVTTGAPMSGMGSMFSMAACPVVGKDGGCPGVLLPPRAGTGVRSLWHCLGLHAIDGRSPRQRKGLKGDWKPEAKALLLKPTGLADQIVRHRTPVYRDVYDETKARLARERGRVDLLIESDGAHGPSTAVGGEADEPIESAGRSGLAPGHIHAIAKKVAVKRFVGDLLTEWKSLVRG